MFKMCRCPNDTYVWRASREANKKNQIGRRFAEIFDRLLDINYYEGTVYGRNYNLLNSDGTSKIYIQDPLEEKLRDFCNAKSNAINYLVGFTGMGKTTLLRNFFKVQDRDVHINKNDLIIYISFYYSSLSADCPQQSVEDEVAKYLLMAFKKLGSNFPEVFRNEDRFWDGLYDYIEENKPINLQNEDITPDYGLQNFFKEYSDIDLKGKKNKLEKLCKTNNIEYYSNIIKYVLTKIPSIEKIYIIFDDIESKEALFHRPVVEVARHLHSCFSCTGRKNVLVKTLVNEIVVLSSIIFI